MSEFTILRQIRDFLHQKLSSALRRVVVSVFVTQFLKKTVLNRFNRSDELKKMQGIKFYLLGCRSVGVRQLFAGKPCIFYSKTHSHPIQARS